MCDDSVLIDSHFGAQIWIFITLLSTGGQTAARHEVKPLHTHRHLLIAEQIAALMPDTVLTA